MDTVGFAIGTYDLETWEDGTPVPNAQVDSGRIMFETSGPAVEQMTWSGWEAKLGNAPDSVDGTWTVERSSSTITLRSPMFGSETNTATVESGLLTLFDPDGNVTKWRKQ
jgi:hypothetical protein